MKRDYRIFLKDIIGSMDGIEEFLGNMTIAQLKSDKKSSSAIIRKFEIIGEAAKNIPNTSKFLLNEFATEIKYVSISYFIC